MRRGERKRDKKEESEIKEDVRERKRIDKKGDSERERREEREFVFCYVMSHQHLTFTCLIYLRVNLTVLSRERIK